MSQVGIESIHSRQFAGLHFTFALPAASLDDGVSAQMHCIVRLDSLSDIIILVVHDFT